MPMAWRSGKLNRHLMLRQNWIACSLNIWLRPRLPLGWPCQGMFGSSQMSSEPRAFSASLYVSSSWCGTSEEPVSCAQATRPSGSKLAGVICATKPFYTANPLIIEYFSGQYPKHVTESIERIRDHASQLSDDT